MVEATTLGIILHNTIKRTTSRINRKIKLKFSSPLVSLDSLHNYLLLAITTSLSESISVATHSFFLVHQCARDLPIRTDLYVVILS